MGVTRRTLLQAAFAVTATGTVATALVGEVAAASSPGDVVGKITVGYQGWFACIGDGAPINAWWHWSQNAAQAPSPSNTGIVAWPDVREYTRTYQTGYAALGNGQPATLLRPADRRHAVPVDAAEQHRHRRAPAVQPHRRRGAHPRRHGGQGPQRWTS